MTAVMEAATATKSSTTQQAATVASLAGVTKRD
jgi:hypothetical protein